jgi:hypothetical protein
MDPLGYRIVFRGINDIELFFGKRSNFTDTAEIVYAHPSENVWYCFVEETNPIQALDTALKVLHREIGEHNENGK